MLQLHIQSVSRDEQQTLLRVFSSRKYFRREAPPPKAAKS
jgi:hypothetical protein